MPGLGASAEEGGSSHCSLAGRACLTVGSSRVNQKTVALKTKMAELAMIHWRVVMLKKLAQLSRVSYAGSVKQSFCKFTRIKSLKVVQLFAHANEVNGNGFFACNGAQHAAFGRAVELGDNESC